MTKPIMNALTVDVEDYFQVAALKESVDVESWDDRPSRVVRNTDLLLDMFSERDVKATFFVLGWVAKRFPELVRRIVAGGHELACHGFSHQLIYEQSEAVFREETIAAKSILEDVGQVEVSGYRAASYSITQKSLFALEILVDAGFKYDSSIVPARHDLYGIADAPPWPYTMVLADGRELKEFPPSTVPVLGQNLPIGGGGYFRLFPYALTRWGLQKINDAHAQPFSFYLHPWEVDPGQPRISVGFKSRFRHYTNLHKTEGRLQRLLGQFHFSTMREVLDNMALASQPAPKRAEPAVAAT